MDKIDMVRGLAIAECLKGVEDSWQAYRTALEAYQIIMSLEGRHMVESIVSNTAPEVKYNTRFEMN